MRKLIFVITLLFSTVINLTAQEHLSFKGIPIEGSMTEFCQKLKSKGFKLFNLYNNGVAMFTGDFTGEQVHVGVSATEDGKNVYSVIVMFDESKEWKKLVNKYDYYKALYTRKYGEPSVCKEYNPARSNDNFSLMHELSQGTVTYNSIWNVAGGSIELSIEKFDYSKGYVCIKYRDAQNLEHKIQKELEDI